MAEAFESLVAWREAMEMVTQVYETTKGFPREAVLGARIAPGIAHAYPNFTESGLLRPAQATDLLKASDNVGRLLNGPLSATPDIRRPKGAPNS